MTKQQLIDIIKEECNILKEVFQVILPYKQERSDKYNIYPTDSDVRLAELFFRNTPNRTSELKYSNKPIDKYIEIVWEWSFDSEESDQTTTNFLKVTGTVFKIVDEYIKNNNPLVLTFKGMESGHDKLYRSGEFVKKWSTLLNQKYDIYFDDLTDSNNIWFVRKDISVRYDANIEKLMEIKHITRDTAEKEWKYKRKSNSYGSIKHEQTKSQLRRVVFNYILKETYTNHNKNYDINAWYELKLSKTGNRTKLLREIINNLIYQEFNQTFV